MPDRKYYTDDPAGSEYILISVLSAVPGTPLPGGVLDNFLSFCLRDVQNSPQEIIFEWLDSNFEVFCTETLMLECPAEPSCFYLASEAIYCEQGSTLYDMTVCNPIDADFNVGYIQIIPSGSGSVLVSPSFIDETANPILPGECRTYTLQLSSSTLAGASFCFDLLAHSDDPNLVEGTLCCSLLTTYCVSVPDCHPCDNIGVDLVESLQNTEECCYNITLFNDYAPDYFDGIDLCILSPQTTMTLIHPPGSIWETGSYSPSVISLDLRSPLIYIPDGVFQLPELCFQTYDAPSQLLEIKWRREGEIVCRDTISLGCEPPCAYLTEEDIACNMDDTWTYQGSITNTSDYVMSEATFVFNSPPGMDLYTQTVNIGPIAPGESGSFQLNLGSPGESGGEVCFTVTLHETGHNGFHTNCCNITKCIVLPECRAIAGCLCNDDFQDSVQEGFSSAVGNSWLERIFTPIGDLTDCDSVIWNINGGSAFGETSGNMPISRNFFPPGTYQVCMRVIRTDVNGTECESTVCSNIQITFPNNGKKLSLYPNPTSGAITLDMSSYPENRVSISIFNSIGKEVLQLPEQELEASRLALDLAANSLANGVYFVIVQSKQGREVVPFVLAQ